MKGETIKPVFIEKTMNANELADELAFKHIVGDDSGAFSSKIITMLRQQQAEIELLSKKYKEQHTMLIKTQFAVLELRKAQEK